LAGRRQTSFLAHAPRSGLAKDELSTAGQYSVLDLTKVTRFVLMVTPRERGSFRDQMEEVLTVMRRVLDQGPRRAAITIQTVFLRAASDQVECQAILSAHFGAEQPVTNIVLQPPCGGAALAIEAWAIRGDSVRFEHYGPQALTVEYDGLRWVHCGGIAPATDAQGVYARTTSGFQQMSALLARGGSRPGHVVRTWLYLGGITEPEAETCRYQELNRARKDFYRGVRFGRSPATHNGHAHGFPASTGIGINGTGLVMSCLALETDREDVFLLPLENPQQTPAYDYPGSDRRQIPMFSRAMALVTGDYVTTWISGTASIVNSESCHLGDIEKQTEQTLDNIERLITAENFNHHGLPGAGAVLNDLAKIRVYLKRAEDLDRCRSVCERRLGGVPAIYLTADVCRSELLVEIEGVAFSKCKPLTP
jgi:enamine deaminase RidA (YjgF/YER057c/UK114 family)